MEKLKVNIKDTKNSFFTPEAICEVRKEHSKTDWARVDALTDEQAELNAVRDPDARPTDAGF